MASFLVNSVVTVLGDLGGDLLDGFRDMGDDLLDCMGDMGGQVVDGIGDMGGSGRKRSNCLQSARRHCWKGVQIFESKMNAG